MTDSEYVRIHKSDLEKIKQVLDKSHTYFKRLNEMNAALHLSDPVHGPLTTMVGNAANRVNDLLDGVNVEDG
ncbi:hypothetical protein LCGC14_2532200 [marine sediment metagenome]|uniref:Uncharacterized protein n=1 Tax=marine sediment metagenome TaxID=412755 RepID=A0A0F9DLG8_9ZZZZ